jgi:uncharacterized protein (DUF697 family)
MTPVKSFIINLASAPDVVLAHAKKAATEHGATLEGDASSGQFSGFGVAGEYQIEGQTVIITVSRKPAILPWPILEARLRSFFDIETGSAETPDQSIAVDDKEKMMSKRDQAEQIVMSHVLWSMGAGLIPVPLFDLAAVTAIQIDLLRQLADLYEVDYSKSTGKTFVSALTGGTLARLGATWVKAIPGLGTLLGGVSMSVLSGASTYAIGQVTIHQLESIGDFLNVDLGWAKDAYHEAFERGKQVVSTLKGEGESAQDVFEALEKLGQLKETEVITAEEFEAEKRKLLNRL